MHRLLALSLSALFVLLPGAAFAHTGHGDVAGFEHGFFHPLGGLDHALAMTAVGVFAYQLGGRALWLVPGAFVFVMALGGALGMAGVDIPFVELGIGVSVVALGAIIALRVNAPVIAAMAIVALFAVFHGHAHGAEMPADASGLVYAAGFMLGTAMLHVGGLALGVLIGWIGESRGPLALRTAGVLTSIAGIALVVGVL